MQHARKRANLVNGLGRRLVVGRGLLGGEQDEVSERITSSRPRTDFLPRTKRGALLGGTTTRSSSGSRGWFRVSPAARGGRGFEVPMPRSPFYSPSPPRPACVQPRQS